MTENVRITRVDAVGEERPDARTDEGNGARVEIPDGFLRVSPRRLLQDWEAAYQRALGYLQALGLPEEDHAALAGEAIRRALAQAWDEESDAVAETLRAIRDVVQEHYPTARVGAAGDFVAWRLERAVAGGVASGESQPHPSSVAVTEDGRLCTTPPINRGRMVPEAIERRFLRRLLRREKVEKGSGPIDHVLYGSPLRKLRRRLPWTRVARRRRLLLGALVLVPTTVASQFMLNVLPQHGHTWLEWTIAAFFGALFGWISVGFWTALFGFMLLMRGRDRFAITHLEPSSATHAPTDRQARTAIVMPICEEPVDRVFAGLRAIHRSLERAGALEGFDFFVLSDTREADTLVREEEAWFDWCREMGGFGRTFYRRRKVRLKRKSGNVADFCRRWGTQYRYAIMLDADSVMAGETIVRLVELMERHADVGMIQTVPVAVNRRSLFARAQQFASRVYGPMFAAGLHYWQLGDGQYWGHNTIMRVAPFMDHCALPRLPGREPLGGEILSHDFVEAALMGRAGWSLWLAYDLGGSYEEVPSTLLEEMRRDRRWCQGNLQHLRLLFTEGLFGAHRALFLNGAFSYMSALLWFVFLTLSTIEAIRNVLWEPEYFPHGPSLFPEWPVWRPDWALALLAVIGLLLFFPKVLSVILIMFKRRDAKAYGGFGKLTLSVLLEIILSSLFAPIRMAFHSRFVLLTLLGRTIPWRSQQRGDDETGWVEAVRRHGVDSLLASTWGIGLFWLSPAYFFWVTPIIGALIVSVPLSVYASRVSLGERALRRRLFLIPEETAPPPELRDVYHFVDAAHAKTAKLPPAERRGFVRAVVDPYVNAVHAMVLGHRRSRPARVRTAGRAVLDRALADGPSGLTGADRRLVLRDPTLTDELHRRVWELPDTQLVARWGRPGRFPPS